MVRSCASPVYYIQIVFFCREEQNYAIDPVFSKCVRLNIFGCFFSVSVEIIDFQTH